MALCVGRRKYWDIYLHNRCMFPNLCRQKDSASLCLCPGLGVSLMLATCCLLPQQQLSLSAEGLRALWNCFLLFPQAFCQDGLRKIAL